MAVSGKRASDDIQFGSGKCGDLCEACREEDVNTHADGVCRECKEYMCATCFQHHLKARQCRSHIFVDLDSRLILDRDEICKQHDNETIKYFCRNHKSVGCGDCMILEHGECKPDLIENLAENFEENEDFENAVQRLENMASAVKRHVESLDIDKETIKTQQKQVLEEIRVFKENIVKIIDKAEEIIIAEAHLLTSKHNKLLNRFEQDLKTLSSEINRVGQHISTDKYRGKSLFVHFIQNKPKLSTMEETLEQIKLKYTDNGYKYKPNKDLLDFLTSNAKFGSLEIMLRPDKLESEKNQGNIMINADGGVCEEVEIEEAYDEREDVYNVRGETYDEREEVYNVRGETYDEREEVYNERKEVNDETEEVYDETEEVYNETEEVNDERKEAYDETEEVYDERKEAYDETEEVNDETEEVNDETEEVYDERKEAYDETEEVNDEREEVNDETLEVYNEIGEVYNERKEVYNETGEVCDDGDYGEIETEKVSDLEEETGSICVGARVRPMSNCTLGISFHNHQPGTIEDIEYGDIMVVKWDYSGKVKSGYRIGKSKVGNGIELVI